MAVCIEPRIWKSSRYLPKYGNSLNLNIELLAKLLHQNRRSPTLRHRGQSRLGICLRKRWFWLVHKAYLDDPRFINSLETQVWRAAHTTHNASLELDQSFLQIGGGGFLWLGGKLLQRGGEPSFSHVTFF